MRAPRLRRPQQIRYEMFDLATSAAEAKRLDKCERIYHRGQALSWNGREILAQLIDEHGGIQIDDEKRRALGRIFSILLWGELAAWKISAQLADRLVPLEAKMAATSQAHDEARHFYVLYEYLQTLGIRPGPLGRGPQALLNLVLNTDELAHKLLGMQLMIETMALTIFQMVREARPEPVLADLLRYYERDEARHVGLGMQYLPGLVAAMNRRQIASLMVFQGAPPLLGAVGGQGARASPAGHRRRVQRSHRARPAQAGRGPPRFLFIGPFSHRRQSGARPSKRRRRAPFSNSRHPIGRSAPPRRVGGAPRGPAGLRYLGARRPRRPRDSHLARDHRPR